MWSPSSYTLFSLSLQDTTFIIGRMHNDGGWAAGIKRRDKWLA